MNKIYLSLGSNLGDRIRNLQNATAQLNDFGRISQRSSYVESEPVGFETPHIFINQCVLWETNLSATEALEQIHKIELSLGRERSEIERYGDRTIDIDILYVNTEIIKTKELQVPHPRISERKFVLLPLAEIAAEWVDPEKRLKISELLERCGDKTEVRNIFP